MPVAPDQPLQLPARLFAQHRVEVRERLVEQQDPRLGREGAGERDALLLAAGEPRDGPGLEPRELDGREGLGHAARPLGLADALRGEPEGDVLAGRHVREERVVLEDHSEAASLAAAGP